MGVLLVASSFAYQNSLIHIYFVNEMLTCVSLNRQQRQIFHTECRQSSIEGYDRSSRRGGRGSTPPLLLSRCRVASRRELVLNARARDALDACHHPAVGDALKLN